MCKKILKNKKRVVVTSVVVLILLSVIYLFSQNNEVKEPNENKDMNTENNLNNSDNFVDYLNENIEDGNSGESTSDKVDENNPDVEPIVDKAKQEAEYFELLSAGLKYKSEGDAGNKDSYYKAIEEYRKASDIAGGKVWIPYLNLGNVYRLVDDFENAEISYEKALEIASEGMIYKAKIDMYRYELEKSEDEVIALYEDAIENVVDNVDLIKYYASYLRDIKRYSDSLKYWKIISEKFPDVQMYKDEVIELENKL